VFKTLLYEIKHRMNSNRRKSFQNLRQAFILLFIFAIAMGFLEGIVVVYLRHEFYPNGFDFPLTLLSPSLLKVEWIREIATIVMLASIAWLAGKNFIRRLSFFLFTFAVWDIFYYVALKLILGWPSSLVTWDVLFLIPIPWLGPVLAPVICSLTMILMAFLFSYLPVKGHPVIIRPLHWILIFTGSGFIFYTFIRDYLNLILSIKGFPDAVNPGVNDPFWKAITSFIPSWYNWWLFVAGEMLILVSVFLVVRKALIKNQAAPLPVQGSS
jgi:hypothetical protein